MLGELPQLSSYYLLPLLANRRGITRNASTTPIASRTADRFETSSVTQPNTRIRTDISMSVIVNIIRQVRSRHYKNILSQHHINIANLFNSMNESLRYTVQDEQNAMFKPMESIMCNYAEAQRLLSLAVSTDNNESVEFYSSVIMLL